jgi:hypothetical protein
VAQSRPRQAAVACWRLAPERAAVRRFAVRPAVCRAAVWRCAELERRAAVARLAWLLVLRRACGAVARRVVVARLAWVPVVRDWAWACWVRLRASTPDMFQSMRPRTSAANQVKRIAISLSVRFWVFRRPS